MIVPPAAISLPSLDTLADCANYTITVQPYLPQLYSLPKAILDSLNDAEASRQLYLATNPIISGLALSIAIMPIAFIVSEINRNYSQIDRVWSILPTLYTAHFAIWARLNGLPTQRVDNVLACSVIWSIRLTYNYWRRGGYQIGSEDYRWELIKAKIGGFGFFLLNIFFIASVQSILLFAVATPTYIQLLTSKFQPTMSLGDVVFSRGIIALVVFEYFADGQQWDYQTAKKRYQANARVPAGWTQEQLDRGFITTGLWKYSRHPNFAAEQTIWIVFYAWACYSSNTYWNWTVAGVVAYLGVFQGSTPLTEGITGGKYPEYKLYQQRVGMFLPKLFGKGWEEAKAEQLAVKKGR